MGLFCLSCSGIPSVEPQDASVPVCGAPSWSSVVGDLPTGIPNQTPPGFIVSILANGGPDLSITYQPSFGIATTVVLSAGNNSNIKITGSWQRDGVITYVYGSKNTFTINSSVFTVTGATVSNGASWSGLNSGVGKVSGQGSVLVFSGYNINSTVSNGSLTFVGTCN